MQSPPKPNNNNLFSFLMQREQGYRAQERESNIIPKMDKRAIISKEEFDSAIKKAKKSNEVGNARLNFPMRDLREITFPPAVTEANETNEANTTYIRSCFIGATFPDKANLPDLNFQKADFSHAKLREANLIGADLSGADLSGADLSEADLSLATLNGANLSGANLIKRDLRFLFLDKADLSYAKLNGANLSCAFLNEADLRGADLSGVNLEGAKFSNANLSGVNLSGLDLKDAKFSNANLSNSNLTNAKIISADFSGADLSGADFSGTLKASITGTGSYYSDISAKSVSTILDKLDDTGIKKMLGIDDKVTVKQYLENLITIPKVKNNEETIDNIKKVIAVIISFEEKIKSTTPSPNTQPSVGGKRKREESLGDGGSARKPEGR